jgi:FkbM family methyltransferase
MIIVQIGACKGNDHVTKLVKENNVDYLLLVEPNPFHLDDLHKCYNGYNYQIDNLAINLNNDLVRLYYSKNDGPLYEVASLQVEHIIKHGYTADSITYFDIKSVNLNEYLSTKKLIDIDYLFIDIEGLDAEISLDFNPSLFNIKNIQIEVLHLGDKEQQVIDYYKSYGYELKPSLDFHGFDIMFSKINI